QRIARLVPRPFRINERDRTALTDAQAVRLGTQNTALFRQPELLQPALEKVPRGKTALFLAAFRGGLIAAEENVAPRHRDADAVGDCINLKSQVSTLRASLKFQASVPRSSPGALVET